MELPKRLLTTVGTRGPYRAKADETARKIEWRHCGSQAKQIKQSRLDRTGHSPLIVGDYDERVPPDYMGEFMGEGVSSPLCV